MGDKMATLTRNLFIFRGLNSKFKRLPELNSTLLKNSFRYGSYAASEKEKPSDAYTSFHKISSDHWKYVERLLPETTVPPFPLNGAYPSGWVPPADNGTNFPFFVPRNKNHMMPVYLNFEAIRLERRLKDHLNKLNNKEIISQVHEVAMFIKFKGDHVSDVKEWLINCGF